MAKAKTPRSNAPKQQTTSVETNVTLMPESKVAKSAEGKAAEPKKYVPPTPINIEEEIRQRAYELSEQRGFIPGYENDDWLVAEREVTARYRQQQSA